MTQAPATGTPADATGLPNVNDLGRIIPTLDPQQLLVFVLLVIIIIIIIDRWQTSLSIRQERKEMSAERQQMWLVSDKFGEAAKMIGDQTDKLVVELQVLRTLAARVESGTRETG